MKSVAALISAALCSAAVLQGAVAQGSCLPRFYPPCYMPTSTHPSPAKLFPVPMNLSFMCTEPTQIGSYQLHILHHNKYKAAVLPGFLSTLMHSPTHLHRPCPWLAVLCYGQLPWWWPYDSLQCQVEGAG